MSIFIVILIGFFIGVIAKVLMPGRDPGGAIITTLVGIGGAVLASYLGQAIGWYKMGQTSGFIGAIIGAMLLLLGYRILIRA